MKSTTWTCMYPLTTFLDFRRIHLSVSPLLLNTHLTVTGFLPFSFTMLLFVGIHAFLDRKYFTSEITDIFHKCSFGLVIAPLGVSGYPASVEIDVLHAHWISSSSFSTDIGMNLASPFTLYFPSMTVLCILGIDGFYKVSSLFSTFNTLSCADMSVLVPFLWYVNYDDFKVLFGLTLSPSSEITYT